ncbi:MAG: hypothetical protein EA370_08975 [Wenzhouxiangella sp.]|nr:MAG: hypothetical protein EA370_08975 [Wenzhouxiangella sp.]
MAGAVWVGSALLMSAGLIALVFGAFSRSAQMAALVLVIALIHLVPAAILYVALAWRNKVTVWACLLSGFLIGMLPIGIVTFPLLDRSSTTNAWVGGTQTVVDGVPTLAGWIQYGQMLLFFGAIGVAAGFVFWRLVGATPTSNSRSFRLPTTVLLSVGVVLIGGLLMLPTLIRDRSCHNVLRDGRTSASPVMVIDLSLKRGEWPELKQFFQRFAGMSGLDYRGSIDDSGGAVSVLSLSLCTEPDFTIGVNEQYWHHRGGGIIPGRGLSIAIFSLDEGFEWKPIAESLILEMNETWPTRVRFRDSGGRLISVEDTPVGDRFAVPWSGVWPLADPNEDDG